MLGLSRTVVVDHPRITTSSGVTYEDLIVGQGRAVETGDEIVIDYVGTLAEGTQFDSSIDRGQPYAFVLGEAPLAGWNEGLLGMRAGGKRRVGLPPERAYGAAGIPGLVPPGASLTFEIDLLSIGTPGHCGPRWTAWE